MRFFSGVFALAALLLPQIAAAQSLSLPIPAGATPSPYGVTVKRVNTLDTAPVTFEGQQLFTIAAAPPADPAEVPPVVQRVYTIEATLRQIAPASVAAKGTRFDVKTFKVEIGNENGNPTLYATDDVKHDKATIMTVTQNDAALNALPRDQLATQWRLIVQSALSRAILASEPDYVRAQIRKLPLVFGGAILVTLIIVWLRRRLRKAGKTIDVTERRTFVAAVIGLLALAALVLWAYVAYWLLTIFPVTRSYANQLSGRALELVTVWIVLAVADRLLGLVILRGVDAWRSNLLLTTEQRARIKLRSPTLIRSAENLKALVLWAIAIFWTLSIVSASAISVLTIGAVVAFAFSFAAQSLIKDYLNGFLILAEDQFAIGDIVTIGTVSGIVEDLTLRITRIRTDEGRLVTIPNSTITAVENATRSWARVDFRVPVAVSSDVERATAVLQEVLDGLAADPEWGKAIIEPPQILGVDAVSFAGVVLRAWVKTLPGERAAVAREMNLRVGEAFRRNGIVIGAPQAVVMQTPSSAQSSSPTRAPRTD